MTEASVVRQVIRYLGLVALLLCGGAVYLADKGADATVLTPICTLAGTTVGALGAMLVSTRSGTAPPAPVEVVNQPEQPVPVADSTPGQA